MKQPKQKKKKKKLKIILIVELILILLLGGFVFAFVMLDKIPKADINNSNIEQNEIDNESMEGYRNIAIFGVDSRANDLKKNTRSDSIMIASINRKTKDVKLVSIYRDTYVNIKDHGYTKINHAYAYGGPELAISTINTNFDMDITDFVTVNFESLTHVIDLLGGIELDITSAELKYVNAYTRDINRINNTNSPYLKQAGKQTVNGTQATAYCRVRYTSGGDFKRAERQRIVIEQILKKAKSASIPTLISVTNKMLPQIYTSLTNTEILGLAKDVFSYNLTDTSGFPFENKGKTINKVSYVLPNNLSANVSQLHQFLFETPDYVPSQKVQSISGEIQAVY